MTAVDETVELMPPLTRGLGRVDGVPLQRGPRYLRTREMGRWHRSRTASNLARYEMPDGPVARCGCGGTEDWS
ncbi:hypothetical protein [Amycolatopsis sp. cmx-4-83]|uniref:hypothetical protein n=1 Tax=Amycolatopsis sp. cmx-4-83 TaxID=2790940 RepID=UPI00397837EE